MINVLAREPQLDRTARLLLSYVTYGHVEDEFR
jgi:hypothetical protein